MIKHQSKLTASIKFTVAQILYNGRWRGKINIPPHNWRRNAQLWTQYDRTLKLRIQALPRDLQCLLVEFIPRCKRLPFHMTSIEHRHIAEDLAWWMYDKKDIIPKYQCGCYVCSVALKFHPWAWGCGWKCRTQLGGYFNR